MPLKNDWQNGDLFTPAAANDMANSVNARASSKGIDLRDYPAVLAANWKFVAGGSFTAGSSTATGTPFTAADVGKIVMVQIDNGLSGTSQVSAACTAGSVTSLTAGTAAWTVNQWAGRIVNYVVSGVKYFARIVSNTSTVLTLADLATGGALATAPVAGGAYILGQTHWKTTITAVSGTTATFANASLVSGSLNVTYGFDGTTAINSALAEIQAYTDGPCDVYLGGNYRLTQLVIPPNVVLRGVSWKNSVAQRGLASLSRTVLAQLPGAEQDFVIFGAGSFGTAIVAAGIMDFSLFGPEKNVIGVASATTGNGVALRTEGSAGARVVDCFRIEGVHALNFPQSGFRCFGAVPMYLNDCKAQNNGRFGFEQEYASGSGPNNALHILNFSADWNNLGALGFKGMSATETVFITGVKSEGHVAGIEADSGQRGGPGYQSNCIVFDNCDRTVALINGVSHIRIQRDGSGDSGGIKTGPGPAITVKDSAGYSKKPRLTFNGVMVRLDGVEEAGTTGDAVTLRDEISSVDITNTVTSGTYPGGPTFPTLLDNRGNKLLQFVGYAGDATAFFNVGNAPNFPVIAAADSTQVNVNMSLQPKGTGTVYVDSTTPSITAGASSGVNRSLDLRSRGTGTVQINAVDAADVSSAQTLSSKTLTSPKINSILDTNGNTIMSMVPVASAVNYIATVNQATGEDPSFQMAGSDANIGLSIYNKGTGAIVLRGPTNGNLLLSAIQMTPGTASNYVEVANAAAGSAPSLSAVGTSTNVNLNLISKGTGVVQANSVQVADISSAQTLTTKTISGASNTLSNIANGSLTNSAITIAGTSTALGASITQDTITGLSTNGLVKRTGANTLAAATADTDYLAPGGALGTPSSGTLTNCTFPTLNQNTSGTAAGLSATLAVTSGGTGATTLTGLIKGSGTSALEAATAGTDYADPATDVFADAVTTGESTIPRRLCSSTNVGSGSGNCRLTYFTARKTETITQVRTLSGSQAAATSTLCRIGIYSVDGSGNLTLIASTPNDTALWAATNTAYTKSLSASFTKTRGNRYAVGIIFVGTTAPQLHGIITGLASENLAAPTLNAFTSGNSDLPSTIAVGSLTGTTAQAYTVLLP